MKMQTIIILALILAVVGVSFYYMKNPKQAKTIEKEIEHVYDDAKAAAYNAYDKVSGSVRRMFSRN